MGYNMSKPELDPYMCDINSDDGEPSRHGRDEPLNTEHEFFHLTKLQSEPSESIRKATHANGKMPMSTVKMLSRREANSSGRGRFSLADRSHLLGRYLPINGPWLVDRMDTRAYVSQFSSDGSLFVAGFQVWDRRCFITERKAAGILTGHLEGITFIDSRGDGRYFISNGKDQTTKLWDIRKMSSNASSFRPRISDWDYRWMEYPPSAKQLRHPCDQSVATYRGHAVLRTLIRCYFSPAYSTGQRYIYTGSHDNCVYIYDVVTGAQVAKLDCHQLTVRDCSWHPYYPMLVSSSWDGLIARWEFPGNEVVPPLGKRETGIIEFVQYIYK